MKPSVGRILHFYTKDTAKQFNGVGEGPYAAIVSQVHGDHCASLTVFPPFAAPFSAGSVMLEEQPADSDSYQRCGWPPRVD